MINLLPEYLRTVKMILHAQIPHRRVFAFGSRVKGKAKPFSDLDLAVMGKQSLTLTRLGSLREAFSASDLPFRVDIVDWATTNPEFRTMIQRDWEEIVHG